MKKLATWVFAFVLLFSLALPTGTTFANTNALKFLVDGVEVDGYEQPFMSHDDVLIPVENLFNEAGFKVSKNEKGIVSATNTHLTVDFNAAKGEIQVDGKKANTEFPLTLRNAGNYVSGEFLSQLAGFEVEVSEDQKTVNVTTNRVKDVDAFLEKVANAGLNSYSANMAIDQKMESSSEELGLMDMAMEMNMSVIQDPIAMHMLTKISMAIEGEDIKQTTEAYFTKDGFYQNDGMADTWVKFDDAMTEGLLQAAMAQADPMAQLEMTKKFMKGIQIFEYEDIYVMTQTMTNEEFKEMMDEMMSLIAGLLPAGLLDTSSSDEVQVTPEATEEEPVEVTVEVTEEEAVEEEATEVDLEGLLDGLAIDIKELFVVTTIDKKTLFPIDTAGTTHMTMGMDEETITIKQDIKGTYSNHNAVKDITIPANVIKNAISMEEYYKQLGIEFDEEVIEVPAK